MVAPLIKAGVVNMPLLRTDYYESTAKAIDNYLYNGGDHRELPPHLAIPTKMAHPGARGTVVLCLVESRGGKQRVRLTGQPVGQKPGPFTDAVIERENFV